MATPSTADLFNELITEYGWHLCGDMLPIKLHQTRLPTISLLPPLESKYSSMASEWQMIAVKIPKTTINNFLRDHSNEEATQPPIQPIEEAECPPFKFKTEAARQADYLLKAFGGVGDSLFSKTIELPEKPTQETFKDLRDVYDSKVFTEKDIAFIASLTSEQLKTIEAFLALLRCVDKASCSSSRS